MEVALDGEHSAERNLVEYGEVVKIMWER